ncbi:MAG: TetR/AcrR family transcriptional regulator [Planctomycetes bacterium]|nr:TetR/AcrR family transcriptional regulator [Planctomycetota bacterium]
MNPPDLTKGDTRERILDAAETLFAEHGFEATSMRAVTSVAQVNLAAVNYHFGSKDGLVQAVFERRVGPLNLERLTLLDRAQAEAAPGPAPLDAVVAALVTPLIRVGRECEPFLRFFNRCQIEPIEALSAVLTTQFKAVSTRFLAALQGALPQLDADDVIWRASFAFGAVAHALASHQRTRLISGGRIDGGDLDQLLPRLIAFIVAGMRAPRGGPT